MVKQCVKWLPVECRNKFGEAVLLQIPESIDIHHRGTLISKILAMPEGRPVGFRTAINFLNEQFKTAFFEGRIGNEPGQCIWYINNFVEWMSNLGYQIQLSGDEFEVQVSVEKQS